MSGNLNRKNKDKVSPSSNASPAAIRSLITNLRSKDGMVRQRSRQSLVAIGKPAVTFLVKLLRDRNDQVRWEVTKALGDIGDPTTASALTAVLEDKEFDVRWLAAEGMIILGRDGLTPLLQALVARSHSLRLREGAHHVLHVLARGGLRDKVAPMLAALEYIDPEITVPSAAQRLLNALRKTKDKVDGK